ncbi:MAG: ADOP family duplicated permease [Terriglobia bacterium]
MKLLSSVRTLLSFVFRRARVEHEMEEELRSHVQLRADDLERSGLTHAEAERQARVEFGGYQRYKEECREALGTRLLGELIADVRYGLRQLRRNPGFTAVAVITLALGIGANTAIFSLVEAALFPPFTVNNPNRLAGVYTSGPDGTGYSSTSYPDYVYYRDHNRVFSGLMAYVHTGLRWTHGDQTTFPWAAVVSGNYFNVLGVKPFIGRTFRPEEDSVGGASAVAVVGYQFWRRQLASNANVVGTALVLNGRTFTIVGVVPNNFVGVDLAWGGIPDIWVPMSMQSVVLPSPVNFDLLHSRQARFLLVMGRLKPRVSLEQAKTNMKVAARQLAETYPVTDKGRTARVLTANESRMWPGWRESVVQVLLLLGVAVGFVLLIACANIANLLLARAVSRQRETAVRLALGGSRRRVILQLLTESVLLSILGATAGLLFARLLVEIIPSFEMTSHMHMNLNLRLDYRVFIFTLILSLITALIFGLVPAFKASNINLSQSLKEGSHRSSAGANGRGLRDAIVAIEMAFAFLSLIGGGLFVRSLLHLESANPGFEPDNILAVTASLSPRQYSPAQGSRFYAHLLDRVSSLPGIRTACLAGFRPLTTLRTTRHITLEGQEEQNLDAGIAIQADDVSPGYFKTLGIPILRGRDFTAEDNAQAPLVAIVNKSMAESIWPRQNPIGKLLKLRGESAYRQVIGVVADIKYHTVWEGAERYMYLPLAQKYVPELSLLVRTKGSPMGFLPEVRRAAGTLDKTVPLFGAETLEEQVNHSLSQPRMMAMLLTLFGVVALVLALVGIYGVVSYSVTERTHEIGIRMALGAQRADVLKLVVGRGMGLALVGVGAGIVAALGLIRLMASLLYGVKPTDLFTFVAVSLVLTGVSALACYIPARRAAKVDPMESLRYE